MVLRCLNMQERAQTDRNVLKVESAILRDGILHLGFKRGKEKSF
jgi:hypothetical protein